MKAIRNEIQTWSARAGLRPQVLERSSGIIIRLSAPMPGPALLSMYVPLSGHDGLVRVEKWREQDHRDLADANRQHKVHFALHGLLVVDQARRQIFGKDAL